MPLIPNLDEKTFIGVRVPILKKYPKELDVKEKEEFLKFLPHKYYEENILHSIILSNIKDYDSFIKPIEERRFNKSIHNKSIQKAVESFRVSEDDKTYLKTLKVKE